MPRICQGWRQFLTLACLLLTSRATAADVDRAAIEAIVRRSQKAWEVPGVAVVIVNGDRVLYLQGHGVRDLGMDAAVTPDTVFPLGSCSKAFTSVVIGQLVDAGTLDWDDPVRRHLPYFRLSEPHADALVTLRDLLSHRTGLAPHDLLWYRATWSQEEMIRRAGRLPLSRPFRTSMQYQSVMYTAAGHAASRAAGRPWSDLVHDRLFGPLGMKSASTRTADALANPDHASAHRRDANGKPRVIPWYVMDKPNPAGSVNASARDLAAWLQLHLNAGVHEGERLVSADQIIATHSPETIIRMDGSTRADHPETKQMSYGMGWVIQDYRGRLQVSHAGVIDGFRTHLTLLPQEKIGLAVLANLQGTRLNLSLSNQLVDHLLGLPPRDWDGTYRRIVANDELEAKLTTNRIEQARVKGTKPTLQLDAYPGVYENDVYGTARIKRDDNGLVLEWSGFRCPLQHFQFDIFRPRGEEVLANNFLEFGTADGSATAFQFVGFIFRRAAPKD